jgi:GT2 family glycosyltransferase
MLKFSIIIPVKSINDYVRETVPYIQDLTGYEWELFIIPNNIEENEWLDDDRISIIESGRVGPADKRDLGAQNASGDILVFLDDDSYPESNILKVASKHFYDLNIIAVGGPGITPPTDSFWQRVSGAVFLSKFTGGAPERYVSVGKSREMDDWPSVNLMVRKDVFLSVGGFDCQYWPGDDTILCLKLKETGKKLIYEPNMVVWHHRRAGLSLHLKQIGAYGLHRGFFAKKYPETSFRFKYFIPSIFTLFFVTSLFYLLMPNIIQIIIILGCALYIVALIIGAFEISKYENLSIALASLIFIFLTHLYYGVNFMFGFFLKSKLMSTLR